LKVILKIQNLSGTTEYKIENLQSISFGRNEKANIKIPDELMSGLHLNFDLNFPRLKVTDLNSKNGTYLNDIKIEQSDVFIGDEIKLGNTKITIAKEKMTQEEVAGLSFKGTTIERNHQELKLDYSRLNTINTGHGTIEPRTNQGMQERKKNKGNLKLTKHEIKLQNKVKSTLASGLDTLMLLFSFGAPLVLFNIILLKTNLHLGSMKIVILFLSSLASTGIFYWFNFKQLKFTIGEKFTGLEDIYEDQELD
jgi:pSer/pThr/pTyr-binding forkhead associated (FHA) protein